MSKSSPPALAWKALRRIWKTAEPTTTKIKKPSTSGLTGGAWRWVAAHSRARAVCQTRGRARFAGQGQRTFSATSRRFVLTTWPRLWMYLSNLFLRARILAGRLFACGRGGGPVGRICVRECIEMWIAHKLQLFARVFRRRAGPTRSEAQRTRAPHSPPRRPQASGRGSRAARPCTMPAFACTRHPPLPLAIGVPLSRAT